MADEQFIGVWRLVSEERKGLLIYGGDGSMSLQTMPIDAPAVSSSAGKRGLGPESGYVGYFGTYEVDEAAETVSHHIQGSLNPEWDGTVQKRSYVITNDRLVLIPTPQALVVWERVQPG